MQQQRRSESLEGQVGLTEGEGEGLAKAADAKAALRGQITERCLHSADKLKMVVMIAQ